MTFVKHNPKAYGLLDELLNFPANWGKDFQSLTAVPVNVHETETGYHLELSVPGVQKEDIKINVAEGLLTVSFEQKQEEEKKDYKTIRREFKQRSFKRSFTVDDKMDVEGIQGKYENGILKLFVPKKEEAKIAPKQITIE
ncbi:Hsp20/alpha crystallin family protein [Chitinophagaceae bacterium LWZ2-11]